MLLSMLLVLSACSSSDDDGGNTPVPKPDPITFKNASLSGAQEVPANNSKATGTFRGSYDPDTKVLSYTITFAGITPTHMHFHKGAVGQDGDIIIGIDPGADPYGTSTNFRSPTQGSTQALTAAQEADLLAGNWFVNIHSNDFPEGEIRAQITR